MNTFTWLLKREYWEHRGGFQWTPIITGTVLLLLLIFGLSIATMTMNRHGVVINNIPIAEITRNATPEQLAHLGAGINVSLYLFSAPIMGILGIVSFFYLLGSLYDERRDRSILFWKSLPVSDTQTVLSKVVSVTVVAPLLALAATLATMLVYLVFLSILLACFGVNPFTVIWMNAAPLSVVGKLVALLPVNALWALPSIGWLMLCSAFARRTPFLWSVLLPVAAGTILAIFDSITNLHVPDSWFWKYVVFRILFSIVPGSWMDFGLFGERMDHADSPQDVVGALNIANVGDLFTLPSMWIGVAAGIAMIAAAIWLRRWRDDS